jgi:hypothetical protein
VRSISGGPAVVTRSQAPIVASVLVFVASVQEPKRCAVRLRFIQSAGRDRWLT